MAIEIPVVEARQGNFPQLVVAKSHKDPVLVANCSERAAARADCYRRVWSDWRADAPSFPSVRVDTASEPARAREQGISSVAASRL